VPVDCVPPARTRLAEVTAGPAAVFRRTVNGKPAEFLAAVGLPGAVDGYQVNFRMPPDIAKRTAIVQLSAAWITSAPVSVAIQ